MSNPVPSCLFGLVKKLRGAVKGERYLTCWVPDSPGRGIEIQVVESFGFDSEAVLTQEPLSLGVLRMAHKLRRPRWSGEHAAEDRSNTFLIAGIQAYLCLPWELDGGVALVYVDDRRDQAAFHYADLLNAQNQLRHPEVWRFLPRQAAFDPALAGNAILVAEGRLSDVGLAPLFQHFLAQVKGQRHVLLLGPDEQGGFQVLKAEGIVASAALREGSLCLEAVERVCDSRVAFISKRSQDLDGFRREALLRCGVQAVFCVPLLEARTARVAGVLYADSRAQPRVFTYTALRQLQQLTRSLGVLEVPQSTTA